ncbi:hypothetical protein SNEBB_006104 [Seison nebaliae]|nr:hypothetical protein SNEBB_006104 [Seison nebaliae]
MVPSSKISSSSNSSFSSSISSLTINNNILSRFSCVNLLRCTLFTDFILEKRDSHAAVVGNIVHNLKAIVFNSIEWNLIEIQRF